MNFFLSLNRRKLSQKARFCLGMAWCLLAGPSLAHVTLEQGRAVAGSSYKAVLKVGHGCQGSATHTVSVELPAGFRGAKPFPKAGWSLSLRKATLAQAYESHGRSISEDVVEITWKANSPEAFLQDAWADEFILRGQLPSQPGPVWFKVTQLCEKGEWRWHDIPAEGSSTKGLAAPAPLLIVTPANEAEHHGH